MIRTAWDLGARPELADRTKRGFVVLWDGRGDLDLDNLRIRIGLAEPERMNGRRVQGDTKS
jgi:hypothetical protein